MGLLFRLSNVLVLPFWALMILLPRWRWTARIMRSPFVSGAPAALYAALVLPRLGEIWPAVSRPTLSGMRRSWARRQAQPSRGYTFSPLTCLSGVGFISIAKNGGSAPGSWRRCCSSR